MPVHLAPSSSAMPECGFGDGGAVMGVCWLGFGDGVLGKVEIGEIGDWESLLVMRMGEEGEDGFG